MIKCTKVISLEDTNKKEWNNYIKDNNIKL